MMYLLSGTDRYRLAQRRQALEAEFWSAHPEGERFTFDFEEAWDERAQTLLSSALASGGLFATPHLVLIRGMETLDERGGERLAAALLDTDESVTAVLVYVLPPRKKLPAWWQSLAKQGAHEALTVLASGESEALIEAVARAVGARIDAAAKRYLAQAFPADLGRLERETERLALSAPDGAITLELARSGVMLPREENVFAALDALIRGDRPRAIALFRQEETEPEAPFALLGLCAWQVRRLIAIKELAEREKLPAAAIAKELKTSPYPIQKTLPLLPKLSFERLRQAFALLADLDRSIKTGRIRPGVALDLFVWKF